MPDTQIQESPLVTAETITSKADLNSLLAAIDQQALSIEYDPQTAKGRKIAKASIAEIKREEKALLTLVKDQLSHLSDTRKNLLQSKTRIKDQIETTLTDFGAPLRQWQANENTRTAFVRKFFDTMNELNRKRPRYAENITLQLDTAISYSPLDPNTFKHRYAEAVDLLNNTIKKLELRFETAQAAPKKDPVPAPKTKLVDETANANETAEPIPEPESHRSQTINELQDFCINIETATDLFDTIARGKIPYISYNG